MPLPLKEVQKLKQKVSKPGNLIDYYVRTQDINNAIDMLKKELCFDFGNKEIQKIIFDKIEKWMRP